MTLGSAISTSVRQAWRGVCLAGLLAIGGCGVKPGVVFPHVANAPVWPPPPDQARITYVGQLLTDQDLKPGMNGFEAMGQAIFGKKESRSMLSPLAVCTDHADRLFVADSNAQLIHVFDFKSRQYSQWTPGKGHTPFSQPVGVAWDAPRARLLVSDSVAAAIDTFDKEGRYTGHFGGDLADKTLQRPVGLAVDAGRNRIFVADAKLHQVLVFASDGTLLSRLGQRGEGPGQFNFPTYLAVDPAGLLYVSDSLNFRIQQFDADLKFVRQIGKKGDYPGYFAQPKGVATDSRGHLYVVDAQFENIQLYNKDGQVLMDFGQEGRGPGEFWLPNGLCIDRVGDSDRIFVADSYNRRIQVFDFHPQPEDAP
ncbi:MAG TPA: 6-bladed beta-propeller [Phycisphaerae bacterium]|nr:6-bladed beta-propeller [Phycisphaerae bacterium]